MVYRTNSEQEKCREIIESTLLDSIYGWRQVPITPACLVKLPKKPEIAQVMFKKKENLKTNDLERDLFETRKKIEKIARDSQLKDFYICSFSSRSIVYKGMFLAEMLSNFIPILMTKLTSRAAVFTRYSTNTFPARTLQPLEH